MDYLSLNTYLKNTFGCKVYKLSIDGGFTCPNRDGTIDTRGCIFCSGYGSGDFAASRNLSITEQLEDAKKRVSAKIKDGKYIAYFQAFTNTYAPVDELRSKYTEAIMNDDIVAISIGTRPDCLSDEIINLLDELNKIKPVWIELGLQTIHQSSADFIRRGYELTVYDNAVKKLKSIGIYVVTHVILGLPGETEEMMLETVKYTCNSGIDGIKLQLLHIIKGTDLAYEYEHRNDGNCSHVMSTYECMTLDHYVALIHKCLSIIPNTIAIHRLTGDGHKKTLLAPLWSGDKKKVLNAINSHTDTSNPPE